MTSNSLDVADDAADVSLNATQKVCAVLRAFGNAPSASLRDLAAAAELNKVTTFRILGTLVSEGFVRRPPDSRLYELGPEISLLATALGRQMDLRGAARPALLKLASQSGDTAVLSIRAGAHAVCLDRQTGDFPIQSNYLYPGTRRPLGVGAGAMAILAALPKKEGNTLLTFVANRLAEFPRLSMEAVHEQFEIARQQNHAVVVNSIVDQMGGIAVAIRSPSYGVVGSFSILALSQRIQSRTDTLVTLLHEAARDTEKRLSAAISGS